MEYAKLCCQFHFLITLLHFMIKTATVGSTGWKEYKNKQNRKIRCLHSHVSLSFCSTLAQLFCSAATYSWIAFCSDLFVAKQESKK